jgi:hypothetical protein
MDAAQGTFSLVAQSNASRKTDTVPRFASASHKLSNTPESFIPVGDWDPSEEKALIKRMDNRILLPCFLMMFIGYLDRQNMANAKVLNAGTPDSIEAVWGLTGSQYSMVISIYGIGLVICEPFVSIDASTSS